MKKMKPYDIKFATATVSRALKRGTLIDFIIALYKRESNDIISFTILFILPALIAAVMIYRFNSYNSIYPILLLGGPLFWVLLMCCMIAKHWGSIKKTQEALWQLTTNDLLLVIRDPKKGAFLFFKTGFFCESKLLFQPYFEENYSVDDICLNESQSDLCLRVRGDLNSRLMLKWAYVNNPEEGRLLLQGLRNNVKKEYIRFNKKLSSGDLT